MSNDAETESKVRQVLTLAREAFQEPEKLDLLFAILSDTSLDLLVRRAAMQGLRQLAFFPTVIGPRNAELVATLRGLLDDPEPELREEAVSMLAEKKDPVAQQRLIDGLELRAEPLVADPKAVALLGNDIHGAFFPLMRNLATESDDPATRLEAVKLLAADTDSADLLFSIFDDKSEDDDVRRASGSALMSVARDRFEQRAKEAVLDDDDTEPVRAASLTALTHFADPDHIDSDFIARVSSVEPSPASTIVASADDPSDFEVREGDLAKAVRVFKKRYGLS
jgi:HEAT repeat protein